MEGTIAVALSRLLITIVSSLTFLRPLVLYPLGYISPILSNLATFREARGGYSTQAKCVPSVFVLVDENDDEWPERVLEVAGVLPSEKADVVGIRSRPPLPPIAHDAKMESVFVSH